MSAEPDDRETSENDALIRELGMIIGLHTGLTLRETNNVARRLIEAGWRRTE